MRLTLKQIRNFIFILSLVLLSGGIGFWAGDNEYQVSSIKYQVGKKIPFFSNSIENKQPPSSKQSLDFSLFWEVWERLEQSYLEKEDLDGEKMFYGAISGMTASLGDPYTVFLPPVDNKTSKEDLNGSFEGVGIQLGYKQGDKLAVIAPLKGMPAEKQGVKAGDFILHIKDEEKKIDRGTTGMTLPEAVKIIRGPRETVVTLTLLHEGERDSYEADLKRETIVIPSVELELGYLDDDNHWQELKEETQKEGIVAWLRLIRFGDLTDDQWDKAVEEIVASCQLPVASCKNCRDKGCMGVVLDLRNNPGGYLDGAVNLAGEFLDNDKVVVKQENSDGTSRVYKTRRFGRLTETPLVVLVNQGSASASEILAGALRDYDRAEIVGEKTFGKGTIQEAIDLREGAGLHVTTAKWLLPDGEWVHEKGIEPDVKVELDEEDQTRDLQLEKAAEILLKN